MTEQKYIPPSPPPYYEDDEITLKELILKIQEFGREIWNNKWWVILFAGIVSGAFLLKAFLSESSYTSSLTFLVSSNKAKPAVDQELAAILGYNVVNYELNKIVELARSRQIVNPVLFERKVLENKEDYLGNHLINTYNFHEKWEEEAASSQYQDIQLNNFYFTSDSTANFDAREIRAITLIGELLAGSNLKGKKGLITSAYDKKTEMVNLTVKAKNKELSIFLLDAIYHSLYDFYQEETVGRPQRAFESLTIRADSLLNNLNALERQLAQQSDRYKNILSKVSHLKLDQLNRKVETTNRVYQEVLRNKERLEFMIGNESADFQIIDRTFVPIDNSTSKIMNVLIGGFLGAFLAIIYILSRKFFRDAMLT